MKKTGTHKHTHTYTHTHIFIFSRASSTHLSPALACRSSIGPCSLQASAHATPCHRPRRCRSTSRSASDGWSPSILFPFWQDGCRRKVSPPNRPRKERKIERSYIYWCSRWVGRGVKGDFGIDAAQNMRLDIPFCT